MIFDRTAYQRTLYNTAQLDESMLHVLLLMATLCDHERRLRTRSLTQTAIMARLHWGIGRARNTVRKLEAAKLLSIIRHDRHACYQLPTEEQLAKYIAPVDPHEKAKKEKLRDLARAAQVRARSKVPG